MESITIPKLDLTPDASRFFDVSFFLNAPVLIIIFIIYALCYVIVSCILVYHWSRYGMKSPGIVIAEILFMFVSLALFWLASLFLLIV